MVQKIRKAKPAQKQDQAEKSGLTKFIKKKPKHSKTKRDNTHVFESFFDRLKNIDVKHSHQADSNYIYDRLMDEEGDNDDTFKSNFIQLLRRMKIDNRTGDFVKVFHDLESYCYSYPLMVHNKDKIIAQLVAHLSKTQQQIVQGGVLDLTIAFVKDLRSDVYEAFVTMILPQSIAMLDIQNVTLVDKVFTMISFAIKYLIRDIKGDLRRFYLIYFEILANKSKHVRRFAAQAFSYVIRKVKFDEEVWKMILYPLGQKEEGKEEDKGLDKKQINVVCGIIDLIFEVIQGTGEGFHSKAKEILDVVLQVEKDDENMNILIRGLLLKLVNEINQDQQEILFQSLNQNLFLSNDQHRHILLLLSYQDMVKLKYGNRLSPSSVNQIMSQINTLLTKDNSKVKPEKQLKPRYFKMDMILAELMGYLYYFKHYEVIQLFSKSLIDFENSQSIFTRGIYEVTSDETQMIQIVQKYMQLFMIQSNEIKQDFSEMEWLKKIIDVTSKSKYKVEFSQESHKQKLIAILKSFSQYVMTQLTKPLVSINFKIELIALLQILVSQLDEEYSITVTPALEVQLVNMLKSLLSKPDFDSYVVYKFISQIKQGYELGGPLIPYLQGIHKNFNTQFMKQSLNIDTIIKDNYILKLYKASKNENQNQLGETIMNQLIDLSNIGNEKDLNIKVYTFLTQYLSQNSPKIKKQFFKLLENNYQDITIVESFNSLTFENKLEVTQYKSLFRNLSNNLSKNNRQLRLQTLEALTKFQPLEYIKNQSENSNQKESSLEGECLIIQMMLDFERLPIDLENERGKVIIIKNLQAIIESERLPSEYVNAVYLFLIGSFWIKFTPIHDHCYQALAEIIRIYPNEYGTLLIELIQDLNLISQMASESDELQKLFINNLKSQPDASLQASSDLRIQLFFKECLVQNEFMEIKDVFYNFVKALSISINVVLKNSDLKQKLFTLFFSFIDSEYSHLFLNSTQSQLVLDESSTTLTVEQMLDAMTYSNMVDSDDFKHFRRIAYSKLCSFLDLLTNADSIKLEHTSSIDHFHSILVSILGKSNDTKMQKNIIDCLVKSNYKNGMLKTYQKLIIGFTDDDKFKDMIQILTFGSSEGAIKESDEIEQAQPTKQAKANLSGIKRLLPEHRLEILPIVISILLTKLLKKKGAINKKSVQTRRTIVYSFFANLDPVTEFPIVFNELLQPFGIVTQENQESLIDKYLIQRQLCGASFSHYLTFLNHLEIIVKQMGNLMNRYVSQIGLILIELLHLTKEFMRNLKLQYALIDDEKKAIHEAFEQDDDEDDNKSLSEESEREDEKDFQSNDVTKVSLYKFVGNQSKSCMRKGLGIVKLMFSKFQSNNEFIQELSHNMYSAILEDQIHSLSTNYISDRSQLIEILTIQWASNHVTLQNYLTYPQIMPALMTMISQNKINSEVFTLHLQMLKTLIDKTHYGNKEKEKEKFRLQKKGKKIEESDEDDQTMIDAQIQEEENDLASQILKMFSKDISSNIHSYCSNHLVELKKTLNNQRFKRNHSFHQPNQAFSLHMIIDIVIVINELSTYLEEGDPINQDFLDMMLSIVSIKALHQGTNTGYYDELLQYGCSSIVSLLSKLSHISEALLDKLFRMFLSLRVLKARDQLSAGLLMTLTSPSYEQQYKVEQMQNKTDEVVSSQYASLKEVVLIIRNLNRLKRGVANMELDYDLIIETIDSLLKSDLNNLSILGISAITYNVVFLISSTELAVRDYSVYALKKIFEILQIQLASLPDNKSDYQTLINLLENQLIQYLSLRDELTLKSVLEAIRHYLQFLKAIKPYETISSPNNLSYLVSLTNMKDENEDFFACFLGIKMKQRQRSLQMLAAKVDKNEVVLDGDSLKAVMRVIIPLVNYAIFNVVNRKQQSQRATITYNRDQQRLTLDHALKVYESISSKLTWGPYFKLLKTFLFKLQKLVHTNKVIISGETTQEDNSTSSEHQKLITKCICKMLTGFNFQNVPDAIDEIKKTQLKREAEDQANTQIDDLGEIVKQIIGKQEEEQEIKVGEENDENGDEAVENEQDEDDEGDEDEIDQVMEDLETEQQIRNKDVVKDIQDKLLLKVLPLLDKQLFSQQQSGSQSKNPKSSIQSQSPIKGYVALSIVKLLRKLPISQFHNGLSKLIKTIIAFGLRSRELGNREKARKALVKIMKEVSPRFLSTIIGEMKDLLHRGFHKKIFIYTTHFIINALIQEQQMYKGAISSKVLDLTMEPFLEDYFEVDQEVDGQIEDKAKGQSKEAKARKVPQIIELYAKYIDFNSTFILFLSPLIKQLESNPGVGKIQQIEELLNKVSSSLMKNESVNGEQLLTLMYTVIQKGFVMGDRVKVNDDKGTRDYGEKLISSEYQLKTKEKAKELNYKVEMKWAKGNQELMNKKTKEISGRVLSFFGLQCLKKALKHKSLLSSSNTASVADQVILTSEVKDKLDPFVPLLLKSFKIYYNPIVVSTLHIVSNIIHMGLPSFKLYSKKFINKILKLFKNTSNLDTDFLNSLFRCMGELIKQYAVFKDLSQQQLHALVAIIRQNLDTYSLQVNVFQCLYALIHKKFVCADMYDMVEDQIQEMMISNVSKSIRSTCSQIFVKFIIEYPMEETRVDSHINHLIKNIAYFDQDGRIQVLEVLGQLIEKFPQEINDKYSELIFFTLMLRLSNDQSSLCKEKIAYTLKKQLSRISQAKVHTFLNTILQIEVCEQAKDVKVERKNAALLYSKFQMIGLFIEAMLTNNSLKASHSKKVVQLCQDFIQKESDSIQEIQKTKQKEYEQFNNQQSKSPHKSKGYDEDLVIKNHDMISFFEDIDLLGNKESQQEHDIEQPDLLSEDVTTMKQSILYQVILCLEKLLVNFQKPQGQALQKQFLCFKSNEPTIGGIMLKVVLIGSFHQQYWIKIASQRVIGLFFASLQDQDLGQALGAKDSQEVVGICYSLLTVMKYRHLREELSYQLIKNLIYAIKYVIGNPHHKESFDLQKFFKRASFIGRKVMLNIMTAKERVGYLLQFYLVCLTLFGKKEEVEGDDAQRINANSMLEQICEPILDLVYRIYTDDQYSNTTAKQSSYEIVDFFQNHMEKALFIRTYNQVKNNIMSKREERKRKQKVGVIGDMEAIKMKEKRREKKGKTKLKKKMEKIKEFIKNK